MEIKLYDAFSKLNDLFSKQLHAIDSKFELLLIMEFLVFQKKHLLYGILYCV